MKKQTNLKGMPVDIQKKIDEKENKKCKRCRRKPIWKYSVWLCETCFKDYDPHRYARIIAYNYYGKAERCIRCDSITNVEWHHPDYNKPLEVIALCKNCHVEEHKQK